MVAIDRTLLMHGPLAPLGCPNLSMKIWSVSPWQARCGHTGALMDKNINFTATKNHSVRKATVFLFIILFIIIMSIQARPGT